MDEPAPTILSKILRKRLETLGYGSLKKFVEDRKDFRYSYELLRQVVYRGRVPRAETLLSILQAMRFSPLQIHKLMEFPFGGYPQGAADPAGKASLFPEGGEPDTLPLSERQATPQIGAGSSTAEGTRGQADLLQDSPEEIASSLALSFPKIPWKGNEDFWEMARALALQAEKKASRIARRDSDQPLLFEKEPEAIYQFLVRKGKVPSYMSKGETLSMGFTAEIDYQDRFRGALLGGAIGEILGRTSQGLSPRDVRELFGGIERASAHAAGRGLGPDYPPPVCLLLAESLLAAQRLDPEKISAEYGKLRRMPGTVHQEEFARNLVDRSFPWFEAGASASETAPAARITPLALLRAVDFRRMKLETGIEAAVTHPHPAAIAGAIAQGTAIARLLHTPVGALDVLGFARGLSHVVSGIEPDRSSRGRTGRAGSTLPRKVGTELTALLLRRAEMEEIQEALGNGATVAEGVPFAWACFLRYPEDYTSAVLAAVNLGNEAEANGAMVGSLSGSYVGAAAIPEGFLSGLPWKEELTAAADGILGLARHDS